MHAVNVCIGSHVLSQVVRAHPTAMLLEGSQTLCCHVNCKLVAQAVAQANEWNQKEQAKVSRH